jgi:hypothetical protein
MIEQIADDDVIDCAYEWLRLKRKESSPNADVWHLRFHWDDLKPR